MRCRLFGLGYSWGGFESLAVMSELAQTRTVRPWTEGPVIRLQVGLEDVADLRRISSVASRRRQRLTRRNAKPPPDEAGGG